MSVAALRALWLLAASAYAFYLGRKGAGEPLPIPGGRLAYCADYVFPSGGVGLVIGVGLALAAVNAFRR